MVYNETDYMIESLNYEVYLAQKQINDIYTKLCLDEAELIARTKDKFGIVLEGELGDRIKTYFMGANKTGRFDLVRPKVLKQIEKINILDNLNIYEDMIPMIIRNLNDGKKKYPENTKQINDQIKWINSVYKDAIKQRRKELQKSIKEGYIIEGELGDRIITALPGGAMKTGRFDLIRPKLLKLVKNAKNTERLNYLSRDLYTGLNQLSKLKKSKPEFEKQITEHEKWLNSVYKDAIKQRRKELKHSISESGFDFGENDGTYIPLLESGKSFMYRDNLLYKVSSANSIQRINYLKEDAIKGIKHMTSILKESYDEDINMHLEWVKSEYMNKIDDKYNQLKNQINELFLEDIQLIQENAIDNIIKIIKDLIQKLLKLLGLSKDKQKDRDSNLEWLKANKDVILKNQFKGSKELPKLWENERNFDEIAKNIPDFNYEEMKDVLGDENAFIQKYFSKLYQKDKNFADVLRGLLYGEKSVLKDNQIPIDKMYNYCLNGYKTRYQLAETAFKKTIDAAQKFETDVKNNKISVGESVACLDRYVYSFLQETLIYEADLSSDGEKTEANNSSTSNTDTNKDNEETKQTETKKVENDQAKVMEVSKKVQKYINISNTISSMLLKYCDDTYDTYISILREHASRNGEVKVKKDNTKENKQKETNTNNETK